MEHGRNTRKRLNNQQKNAPARTQAHYGYEASYFFN